MNKPKITFIDNYDSFANLITKKLEHAGAVVTLLKSDDHIDAIDEQETDLILLGPGPNGPYEAGNYLHVISKYHTKVPMFGICLGLQAMVAYFGGKVHPLEQQMHGKTSKIIHDGKSIFQGMQSPAELTRYHSLGTYRDELPECLLCSAYTIDGGKETVMGIRHQKFPIEAVQFHPESVLSGTQGERLLENLVSFLGRLQRGKDVEKEYGVMLWK